MYCEFYCFSKKPFETIPDPEFLYLTPNYRLTLDTTIKSIRDRSGFVSVTGEAGTGKTMLIYSILIRLNEKVKTAFVFYPPMTFPELISKVLQDLDLPDVRKSREALLKQLSEYFLKRLAIDETLVVFIDEAQNLSKEVMEEFGKLQEMIPSIANRLQIIFVGQPECDDKLNSQNLRQLAQNIGTKCKIRALTEEESRAYIEHRLKIAGSSSSHVFSPDGISMIVHHAKGIPRVINNLCDNAFRTGYGLFRKKVDVDIIRQVIREMEGPIPQKSIPSEPLSPRKGFNRMPLRHIFYHKRFFFVLLSLLFVAGFILLVRGGLKQKPTITWSIESIMKPRLDTEIASKEPLSQTRKQEILEAPLASNHQDSKSQGLLQPISPPSASRSPKHKERVFEEVIAVGKGQTISSLAQKYYRMANPTLIDLILDSNPEITNVDLIQVNQKLKIPTLTKEWLIKQSPDHTCKIHVGTFWAPLFVKPYKEELTLKGKRIEVLPRKVSPTDTWYRVMVGDFDNKEDALKMIDLLKEKKLLPIYEEVPD